MTSIVPSSYRKLIADIVRIYDNTRYFLVRSHWDTGKKIFEIEQDGASRAAYGSRLLSQISEDLTRERGPGFSGTNLKRFRRFYLTQKGPPVAQLGWSHQNELMVVRDPKQKRTLEKKAVREGLSRNELRDLIREKFRVKLKTGRPSMIDVTPLVPKRGVVNTYQIKSAQEIGWPVAETLAGLPGKDVLLLDHGFKSYRVLTPRECRGLKAGDIVEVKGIGSFSLPRPRLPNWQGQAGEEKDACPPPFLIKKSDHARKDLFTYKAFLEKLIDGDTFRVVLVTGLDGVSRQKLRLRGIDCPEMKTAKGKAAKKFVESVLAGVSCLTVCSFKNDKYGRYEADVFFEDKEGKEVFLNNLLLETGHAVLMPIH